MSDVIRDKVDRHEEIIGSLQKDIADINSRQRVMEERIDRNQAYMVEILSRIEHKVDSTQEEVKETKEWVNRSEGGLRLGKWIAGIGLTVLGVGLAFLKFFKGG